MKLKRTPGVILAILLAGSITQNTSSQEPSVIPVPASIHEVSPGTCLITSSSTILCDTEVERSALYLAGYCQNFYNLDLKMIANMNSGKDPGLIRMVSDPEMDPGHYTLQVSADGIVIRGSGEGIFYGVQSLIQMMPVPPIHHDSGIRIAYVYLEDGPRFGYRGMLLDVSRHFFSIDFLKRYVDFAAWHKLNYLHLHLTDDQGWRIESRKYPLLNEIGSWREGTMKGIWPGTGNDSIRHGGYYTREQLSDLITYAQDRYVTVVPEIEMPGHALAALASYSWLGCTGGPYRVKETWGAGQDVFCAGKESTYEFLEEVLDEVMEIFPSEYIHIGGDECPKERWENCAACQERIKAEGLNGEDELQSYLIERIEQFIRSMGRTLIGWDEILEGGITQETVVMSWRGDGEQGCLEAVRTGHRVILSPSYGFYLDYPQTSREDSLAADWGGVTSLSKTYHYEPVNDKLKPGEAGYILGGQANVWTEYINNEAKAEYMTFPRLSAVSEVLWSPSGARNWEHFKERLELQYDRYSLWGIRFNPAHPDWE